MLCRNCGQECINVGFGICADCARPKKKWTKEQKKILGEYWETLSIYQDDFLRRVDILEQDMQETFGVKDLEFEYDETGSGYYGIGNRYASPEDKYELWVEEE